jgi:hypothetical protein
MCSKLGLDSQKARGKQGVLVQSLIPALGKLRKKDGKFGTKLDYIVRLCLKKRGAQWFYTKAGDHARCTLDCSQEGVKPKAFCPVA